MFRFKKCISIEGLLSALGSLISLATVAGFGGSLSWLFDLASHFRIQYLLILFLIIAYFTIVKRFKKASLFLLFFLLNLFTIVPLFWGRQSVPNAKTSRIMLLNVYTQNEEVEKVRNEIVTTDPDLLILQEIDQQWIKDLQWLDSIYPYSYTFPRSDNFGIGMWSKTAFKKAALEYVGEAGLPSINAMLPIGDTVVQVIATHPLPPVGKTNAAYRNEQLSLVPQLIVKEHPTIIVGDLNSSCWGYNFKKLLKESGLNNSAKGFGFQPTWPSGSPLLYTAIDHLLHSDDIVIADRQIGNNVGSDHLPLVVDFTVEN